MNYRFLFWFNNYFYYTLEEDNERYFKKYSFSEEYVEITKREFKIAEWTKWGYLVEIGELEDVSLREGFSLNGL
jgi:hypothetical protein